MSLGVPLHFVSCSGVDIAWFGVVVGGDGESPPFSDDEGRGGVERWVRHDRHPCAAVLRCAVGGWRSLAMCGVVVFAPSALWAVARAEKIVTAWDAPCNVPGLGLT
jgi:hypothetical protein